MKKAIFIFLLFASVSTIQSYRYLAYPAPTPINGIITKFDAATGKGNVQAKCNACGLSLPNNFNFDEAAIGVPGKFVKTVYHKGCAKDTIPSGHKFDCGAKW